MLSSRQRVMEGPRPTSSEARTPSCSDRPRRGQSAELPSSRNRWLGGEKMERPGSPKRLGKGGVSAARAVRWSAQDRDGALGILPQCSFLKGRGSPGSSRRGSQPPAATVPRLWPTWPSLRFLSCVCALNICFLPKRGAVAREEEKGQGGENSFLSPQMDLSLQTQACKTSK